MIPAGAGVEACPGGQDRFGPDQRRGPGRGQAADSEGGPGQEGSQGAGP